MISPAVAAGQFAEHAGTFDDEIALLVVHGVLHVLGFDHAEPDEAAVMRRRELELLEAHCWARIRAGRVPSGPRLSWMPSPRDASGTAAVTGRPRRR